MKKIFVIMAVVFAVCIYSQCVGRKIQNSHYEGYIYTTERQPIPGLRVSPDYMMSPSDENQVGITDENGYFKFEKFPNIIANLNVEYEGKIIKTINVIRRGAGGRISFYFVHGSKDTLFIDMKDVKKFFYGYYNMP